MSKYWKQLTKPPFGQQGQIDPSGNVPGYHQCYVIPPQSSGKNLLLKIPCTHVIKHEEIELMLN